MKNKTPDTITKAGPLCEKLWNSLTGLTQCANELKEALITRNNETIWMLVSKKQEMSTNLQQSLELWAQIYDNEERKNSPEIFSARELIKEAARKLKLLDKINYTLINSYLRAIEKGFIAAGTGVAGKKKTYNRGGRLGLRKSALLLKTAG